MAHRLTRANWLWQIACLLFIMSTGLFVVLCSGWPWWTAIVHVVLVSGNAFLIQLLVRHYELLGNLSIFPATIYFLLNAACPSLLFEPQSFLASACLLATCLNFFECYRQNECRVRLFNAFFFLSIAGIFLPRFLLLIPVFWIIFNIVNTLNFKRWIASLFGMGTVIGAFLALTFVFDRQDIFDEVLRQSIEGFYSPIRPAINEWVLFAGIAALSLISIFHFLGVGVKSRRNSLRLFNTALIVTALLCMLMMMLFWPSRYQFLILLAAPFAIMTGIFFNDVQSIVEKILAYLSLACGIYFCLSTFTL